jgi:hypothetical protein
MSEEIARRYRGRFVWADDVYPFHAFDARELEVLEAELGRPLPAAYRAFLEVANGGNLEHYAIAIPPERGGGSASFCDLYRLGADEAGGYGWETLLGEYRRQSHWWLAKEIPLQALLPIARTGGEDDTLFVDLSPQSYGRVLAYRSGRPAWTGQRQTDWFDVVAEDFDAYLDCLFVDDYSAKDCWYGVWGLDPADPVRRTVEEWLDHEVPQWRMRPWATR